MRRGEFFKKWVEEERLPLWFHGVPVCEHLGPALNNLGGGEADVDDGIGPMDRACAIIRSVACSPQSQSNKKQL